MLSTASEIFEHIRLQVRNGHYKPNDTLPPVREMAEKLNVNRNTVSSAYKKLVAAGIATTQGRRGTIIRAISDTSEQEGIAADSSLIDAASGNPCAALLPSLTKLARHIENAKHMYGTPVLNSKLAAVGHRWLGPDVRSDYKLMVTHGAVDAVERLLSIYLMAGDRVAVEDPCFLSSISTLKNNGFVAAGIPMDEDGIDVATLSRLLSEGVQAVIITPRAHNPTGWALSAERAELIREVLSQYPHVFIVIDDHFSVLSSSHYYNVIPENTQRWALVRTVSKFFGPDMRLALLASDAETALRLQQRLAPGTGWVSHILQDMVAGGMESAELNKTLQWAKELYYHRREAFVRALQQHGLQTSAKHGGLNVWVPLKNKSDKIVAAIAKHGWLIRGGHGFGVEGPVYGLRITVSELDDGQVETLAGLVAKYVHKFDK